MKKKWNLIYSFVLVTLVLSACTSVDADAVQKYKQENVLEIDITLPEIIETGTPQIYIAKLIQKNIGLDDPDEILFHIWSSDQVNNTFHETIQPMHSEGGIFKANITIPHDGIYYLQVTASSQGSEVTPTMQLLVGDVEVPEVSTENKTTNGSNHSGKHH